MAEVAAAARTIAWTSDETWDRILSSVKGPRGRSTAADRHVGPGLVIRDGVVELTADADAISDPTLVLRAAAAAAEAGLRLSRRAVDRLAAEATPLGDSWPEEARLAFVRLLGAGHAAIPVIETLDQRGLMTRTLPEWEHVRNRPQRNAYHRFTVDRHLCEAAAEAARLTSRVRRPDLLLVGAFLHDIGKGYPGDHSEAGVNLVEKIGAPHGLPARRHHRSSRRWSATTSCWPTRPPGATWPTRRRSPRWPPPSSNQTTLELLAALTEADSLATGPPPGGRGRPGSSPSSSSAPPRCWPGSGPARRPSRPPTAPSS